MPQFLAMFTGGPGTAAMARWAKLTDEERTEHQTRGVAEWNAWAVDNATAVVNLGGPLGKTLRVSPEGVAPASNMLSGFSIIEADSVEAAAAMFENHPHFTIFPGDAIDVMPIMAVPGQG